MSHLARFPLAALFLLLPMATTAQEAPETPAPDAVEDGFNLIDEGAKLLLRGLQEEMKPMMEDLAIEMEPRLREFAGQLMPLLEGFSDLVGDLDAYHPPERLPNGDIILRRKVPLDPGSPAEEGGEVEL